MGVKLLVIMCLVSILWVYLLMQDLEIFACLRKEVRRISFVKLDKGFLASYGSILIADLIILHYDSYTSAWRSWEKACCKWWILILSLLFLSSVVFSCIMSITPEYLVVYGRKIDNDSKLHLSVYDIGEGRSRVTLLSDHKQYVFETATQGKALEMIRAYYRAE